MGIGPIKIGVPVAEVILKENEEQVFALVVIPGVVVEVPRIEVLN